MKTRLISLALVSIAITVLGCAPRQGAPTNNPFAQNAAPQVDSPAPGRFSNALRSLRPETRSNVMKLYERAKEQERLAAEQQRELNRLRKIQKQYEKMLAAVERKEETTKEVKISELAKREQTWQQRAKTAMQRYKELENRSKALDADNRDLQSRLAQTQKQFKLLADQNELLRKQLRETLAQLDDAQSGIQEADRRLKALQASNRHHGGVHITANNSLKRKLTAVTAEGLEVRQDGELVRIVLPSDQLFQPGTATLVRGAEEILNRVADVLLENYSNQIIGVEAHTDSATVEGTLWRNAHHLTSAQAMAVFEQLSYRHRLLPQQMFVMGHGANYPIVSNATPAGQARNRRIEIVIYPETVSSRR